MTYPAILAASAFLLLAYGLDRVGSRVGLPSVMLLILTGLLARPVLDGFGLHLGALDALVPIVGTIGLVLIVLEGAFDIRVARSQLRLASAASASAVAGFLACLAVFAPTAHFALSLAPAHALLLAIPLSVISSAVAIPSSGFLPPQGRQFVVYESSVSDILGILLFATVLESDGTVTGISLGLVTGGLVSLLVGAVCAAALTFALARLDGHIRFIPLLAGLLALYATAKMLHLSPLLMVLLFGLLINNLDAFARVGWIRRAADVQYRQTLAEFKTITCELTFAVRGFFFILMGYWTDLSLLASPAAWLSAGLALAVIFGTRRAMLRWFRLPMAQPLAWIAPRGLITVLLFLSAKQAFEMPAYLDGAMLLVVFGSSVLIALGRRRWHPTRDGGSPA